MSERPLAENPYSVTSDSAGRPNPFGGGLGVVLLGLLALAAVVAALAAAGWLVRGAGWNGPAPFLWPIFPFGFFLGLVIVGFTVRAAFWGRGGRLGSCSYDGPGAGEIARRRYARGEINRQELLEILHDVGDASGQTL